MTSGGVMPHPWWQFWQIADFLIMLAVVVLFVRYVRRSDARQDAPPEGGDADAPAVEAPPAAHPDTGDAPGP